MIAIFPLATTAESRMGRLLRLLKRCKVRKSSIWFLVLTMTVAMITWTIFLVFFGRIDPIIQATTERNEQLYEYSLVTLPFWLYAFFAPFVYPVIALYIANGNWLLGIISHIAGASLGFLLGAVLNMSAAVVHVIRNLDHNTTTRNICIAGMVAVVVSLINLVILMIAMPTYERWSNTTKLRRLSKHAWQEQRGQSWSSNDSFEEGIYETFLAVTLTIATIGWIIFLVFFGRISPIIKATTEKNFQLYNYSLVTLPFWLYAFFAPLVYPVIALYIINGNWVVGIISHIAGASLGFLLGAVVNMSAAVIHVIRNLDHNTTTRNICIFGMLAVMISLFNLIALMVAMPTYDRWSNTRKLRTIAKHIEVTVGKKTVDWSDSDFEQEMEGMYVNTNVSPNHGQREEPVYINVHEAKETKKSTSDHRLKNSSDYQLKSTSAPRMSPTRPPNPPSRPTHSPPSRPPHSSSRPPHSPSRPPHSSSNTRVGQSSSRHATASRPHYTSSHHSNQSRQGHSPTRPT